MNVFHVQAGLANQAKTIVESVHPFKEMVFPNKSRESRTDNTRSIPKTAAHNSRRGNEIDLTGATRVLDANKLTHLFFEQ